ncbi:MAG: hypothetical protein BGO69_05380 [Bacteroidetes bacterium 46-16]|nr:MAG: hypothetical protein BGO69_05380 [Bacteroidetes bacterium 46-16]
MDVTEIVHFIKLTNPNIDFDLVCTFYYDETNNVKKFHLKAGDFNTVFHSDFILGGLAYFGERPDINDIFSGLDLQPNVTEVKLKHIATNGFEDCLRSTKLTTFLNYLLRSALYLHYSSLNLLYYSLVDIVDSAIHYSKPAMQLGMQFSAMLKTNLYIICQREIDIVTDLFFRYKYPNIEEKDVPGFIDELVALIEKYEDEEELHVGLVSLRQILQQARKANSLPFIMDETDHMLISGFTAFYMRPVYTFARSTHYFDAEADIQNEFANDDIILNGQVLHNYHFLDSKADRLTQASDVIVGLIGKFSKFINTHTIEELEQLIGGMNAQQQTNLDLYLDLVLKSERVNPGFFHSTTSFTDKSKEQFLFFLRGKSL